MEVDDYTHRTMELVSSQVIIEKSSYFYFLMRQHLLAVTKNLILLKILNTHQYTQLIFSYHQPVHYPFSSAPPCQNELYLPL